MRKTKFNKKTKKKGGSKDVKFSRAKINQTKIVDQKP